jgi:predicted transcriptional regulator
MARPKLKRPTDRELEILQVLWRRGPATARDIVEELNKGRREKLAYNSVLTILNIMHHKGYALRDTSGRSHVYEAAYSQDEIERQLIERLIDDVFSGSAMRLVSRALSTRPASAEEIEEVRELLEQLRHAHRSSAE